jgi:hypothetical protein
LQANKKSQGNVVDLVLLIIIVSLFFVVLINERGTQSLNAGALRARSVFVQNLLITTLHANSTYNNASIAEIISMNYCGKNLDDEIVNSVNRTISYLNKQDYYYILSICPNGNCDSDSVAVCSKEINNAFGSCCAKTEKATQATINITLPTGCKHDYFIATLGVISKNEEMKPC